MKNIFAGLISLFLLCSCYPGSNFQSEPWQVVSVSNVIIVSSSPYAKAEPVMAFHTSDGGQMWMSESIPVLAGPVYLARQGGFLTMITGVNQLTLFRYAE